MSFFINIDVSELEGLGDLMESEIRSEIQSAAADLQMMVAGKMTELARAKLKGRYKPYVQAISSKQVSDDTWVVTLDAEAMWIEDGQPEFNMLDGFLASPNAKTAQDGSKYMVVPFPHGPGLGDGSEGGEAGAAHQDIIGSIKAEMRRRKIPFARIEKGDDGKPLLGKLHSFPVSTPLKSHEGPGQGKGAVGRERQGQTGSPFLNEVSVYQTETKDKKGKSKVQRSVMTFRVASSKQQGMGIWDHPGNEGEKIMDEAFEWAKQEWEQSISPEIVANIIARIG